VFVEPQCIKYSYGFPPIQRKQIGHCGRDEKPNDHAEPAIVER